MTTSTTTKTVPNTTAATTTTTTTTTDSCKAQLSASTDTNVCLCEQTVRERAYSLWEQSGYPESDGVEFWARAEQELLSEQSLQCRK